MRLILLLPQPISTWVILLCSGQILGTLGALLDPYVGDCQGCFLVNNDRISVREFLQSQDLFSMFYLPLSHEAAAELHMLEGWIMQLDRDPTIPDVWIWPGQSGGYTTKSFYMIMHSHLPTIQPCKWLWQSKCTMKIKVFG